MYVYNNMMYLIKLYGVLYSPCFFLTPFRKFIRYCANILLPWYLGKNVEYKGIIQKKLIVSLTSFPARIENLWMVIETIKRQTILPEKIILWLSVDQFPSMDSIPIRLLCKQDEMFEIRMVNGDIRSHKKYYYAMKYYPDFYLITLDDDVFYHPDTIKHLVLSSNIFPNCVIANICKEILYDNSGNILPYKQWKRVYFDKKSIDLVQIGVGGVLYPPHLLSEFVLRKDLFLSLSPLADDIWLNCMARLNNVIIKKTNFNFLPLPIRCNAPTLTYENVNLNKNDLQIKYIQDYFKQFNKYPYKK